jgi:hypothetical protein
MCCCYTSWVVCSFAVTGALRPTLRGIDGSTSSVYLHFVPPCICFGLVILPLKMFFATLHWRTYNEIWVRYGWIFTIQCAWIYYYRLWSWPLLKKTIMRLLSDQRRCVRCVSVVNQTILIFVMLCSSCFVIVLQQQTVEKSTKSSMRMGWSGILIFDSCQAPLMAI